MRFFRQSILWALLLVQSGCYLPASTNWYQFSGSFCGRETITERACSVGFSLLTLPVQLGALVIDMPFSLLEFLTGWAPFDQDLIETSENFPLPYMDENGALWAFTADPNNQNRLLLTKAHDGLVIDAYWVSRVDGENIGIVKTVCEDFQKLSSCSSF